MDSEQYLLENDASRVELFKFLDDVASTTRLLLTGNSNQGRQNPPSQEMDGTPTTDCSHSDWNIEDSKISRTGA